MCSTLKSKRPKRTEERVEALYNDDVVGGFNRDVVLDGITQGMVKGRQRHLACACKVVMAQGLIEGRLLKQCRGQLSFVVPSSDVGAAVMGG